MEKFSDLAPGEEASLPVEFSSLGRPLGEFRHQIAIAAEGAEAKTIVDIVGEIGTIMVFADKVAKFENVGQINSRYFFRYARKTFVLQGRDNAPISPYIAPITVPYLQAEVVSVTKFYWELRLDVSPQLLPAWEMAGSYNLVVNDGQNWQTLEVPVVWTRLSLVTFGQNPLLISARSGEPFQARLGYKIIEKERSIYSRQMAFVSGVQVATPPILPAKVVSVRAEGASLQFKVEKDHMVVEALIPEKYNYAFSEWRAELGAWRFLVVDLR
jgi:hypothetical protein